MTNQKTVHWAYHCHQNATVPLSTDEISHLLMTHKDSFVADPVQSLTRAILSNKTTVVESLLRAGTPVFPDETGRHPLHIACGRGHQSVVELLLALSDIDPDLPDKLGYSVLFKAAASGDCELLRLLLRYGSDVNRTDQLKNNSPLHEAARRGFSRSVKLLCEAGANPYARNKVRSFPIFPGFSHSVTCCAFAHTCRTYPPCSTFGSLFTIVSNIIAVSENVVNNRLLGTITKFNETLLL
ncbi:unnamed protein product [Echinostoma caproni]|uniref:ANK_REP_REGION domain-containing protein n=1 Tax=Echinostoma caproni TaxID=27848 RepID=A0A183BA42_9TREM|nr:unnamed protein product [Echinostoma caproni]